MTAPIDALMGVFLDDTLPIGPPVSLLFMVGDLDFLTLSPLLKQVFFIGDGTVGDSGASSGGATQEFFVPTGATRLYLGTMDGFGWENNAGEFSVEVLELIPEPTSIILALIGSLGMAVWMFSKQFGR